MCQPKECVQQLQAANFVSHELKTDFVIGCIQRTGIADGGEIEIRPLG